MQDRRAAARVGSPDEWRRARLALLDREKELNRLRDELAAGRRRLPCAGAKRNVR